MLGIFPRMAVSLQRRTGNINRIVVAVNREAGVTTPQPHGGIMILAISDPPLSQLFDTGADLKHSVLTERQQHEAKVDRRRIRPGFDFLNHAPQCRRTEPRQYTFGSTLAGDAFAPDQHREVEVGRDIVVQHDHAERTVHP